MSSLTLSPHRERLLARMREIDEPVASVTAAPERGQYEQRQVLDGEELE